MWVGGAAVPLVWPAIAVAVGVVPVRNAIAVLVAHAAAAVVVVRVVGVGNAIAVAIAPRAATRRLLRLLPVLRLGADINADLGVGCLRQDERQGCEGRGYNDHGKFDRTGHVVPPCV